MASFEIHIRKYDLFTADALNEQNSPPTRIEALFEACFHLIEACAAKEGVHINKHQLVRPTLLGHQAILGEGTEQVWRAFDELQNQIRPGQAYGGRINGEALKRAEQIAATIKEACDKVLRKASTGPARNTVSR